MIGPTGRRIAELRRRFGLSQTDLSHLMGCTFSAVSRWENGHNRPKGINARLLSIFELASNVPGIADHVGVWSQRGPLFVLYRLLGEVFERADWLEQLVELQRELELEQQLASTSPAARRGP